MLETRMVLLAIFFFWTIHDSFYTKIRRESLLATPDMDKIRDWSLYAKGIKFLNLCLIAYLTDYILLIYWAIGFDQLHWFWVRWRFMNWNEWLKQIIVIRIYQWFERRFS